MATTTTTIGDVLSGNASIKVAIGFDTKQAIIVGVVLFAVVVLAGIIIKKI